MNNSSLIAKIALGVAIAALGFSIVTLIRSIINGAGVLLACILVVGTAIVAAICVMLLSMMKNFMYDDDLDDEDDEDDEPSEQEAPATEKPSRRVSISKPSKKTRKSPDIPEKTEPAESPEITGDHDNPITSSDRDDLSNVEKEVDSIIAELETKGGYDLSNFV